MVEAVIEPVLASPEARSIDGADDLAWINELYRRVRAEQTQAAMDLLLGELDQRFDQRAFAAVDRAFERIELDRLNVTLVIGLLSFTKAAGEQLLSRAAWVERAERWLRDREPERVERMMARVR